jgi:carboxyl-terminal processing protease
LDGGDTREENLQGALDNGKGDKDGGPANTKKADVMPATDQSKIDYQLARALDLIRGVSIFTDVKSGS